MLRQPTDSGWGHLGSSRGAGALLLVALLTAAGCTVAGSVNDEAGDTGAAAATVALPTLDGATLVDLTHPLSPESLYWPNGSAFEYEREIWGAGEDGLWYAMGKFTTPEHLGTHLDAPIHFAPDVWTNADIPIDRLFGPAVVIDIAARAETDPDAVLEVADIDAWEGQHSEIPAGTIVLVRSGWSTRWPDWNAYYGSDDPFDTTTLHFPGVSAAAAAVLVARGAHGVGIDTASIDPGISTGFEAHRVLAEGQLYNLENLTGLEQLPEVGAYLIALPIKIAGGSGGPARVIAALPAR
jgi:kynurenine formamidase